VGFEELKGALKEGFEKAFGIRLVPGQPIDFENSLAAKLRVEKYATRDWNFRR